MDRGSQLTNMIFWRFFMKKIVSDFWNIQLKQNQWEELLEGEWDFKKQGQN